VVTIGKMKQNYSRYLADGKLVLLTSKHGRNFDGCQGTVLNKTDQNPKNYQN